MLKRALVWMIFKKTNNFGFLLVNYGYTNVTTH